MIHREALDTGTLSLVSQGFAAFPMEDLEALQTAYYSFEFCSGRIRRARMRSILLQVHDTP